MTPHATAVASPVASALMERTKKKGRAPRPAAVRGQQGALVCGGEKCEHGMRRPGGPAAVCEPASSGHMALRSPNIATMLQLHQGISVY